VPERLPELCPGCPHRATFSALKRTHVTVTGDLGCAALAGHPPLSAVARAPVLGAAVGVAMGLEAALGERIEGRSVALVGDGALMHSALPALARMASGRGVVVIADNGSTPLPPSIEERGREGEVRAPGGWRADLPSLCSSLGVCSVRVVDPFDLEGTVAALREELARPASSVVIARAPCARQLTERRPPMGVRDERCNRCGACFRLGCPAIRDDGVAVTIASDVCSGCGLCAQVCRAKAIGQGLDS
jgi:indolepyruvate ferredoxin oxidoreductase alpha subunit